MLFKQGDMCKQLETVQKSDSLKGPGPVSQRSYSYTIVLS